jgi:hypothetical protein
MPVDPDSKPKCHLEKVNNNPRIFMFSGNGGLLLDFGSPFGVFRNMHQFLI